MNILIVYGSQFGNTRRLAMAIGDAMRAGHQVRVLAADDALDEFGTEVDLLLFGTPTQIHGMRVLGRHFLDGLERRAFGGLPVAAFDTRLAGSTARTGSAAQGIAHRFEAVGCRLVVPPESFVVDDMEGPLAIGEVERAASWAGTVLDAASTSLATSSPVTT